MTYNVFGGTLNLTHLQLQLDKFVNLCSVTFTLFSQRPCWCTMPLKSLSCCMQLWSPDCITSAVYGRPIPHRSDADNQKQFNNNFKKKLTNRQNTTNKLTITV